MTGLLEHMSEKGVQISLFGLKNYVATYEQRQGISTHPLWPLF